MKTNVFDPVSIIVMQNTTLLESPKSAKMVFDLKGSTTNRYVGITEDEMLKSNTTCNLAKVMKDNNFRLFSHRRGKSLVELSQSQSESILNIITKDTYFLCKHKLMDYSFLLIIETIEPNTEKKRRKKKKQMDIERAKRSCIEFNRDA